MSDAFPRAPEDQTIHGAIADPVDRVLELVLSARQRTPASHLPKRLHGLFRELGKSEPANDPDDIEDLIWALWISHPDRRAADAMSNACEAMAAGAFDIARQILDNLIEAFPDWPEAWNKRAILSFIAHQDSICLADLERTLELEPRHFGAISGFAQLCMRLQRPLEAKAALAVALSIDPHLKGLRRLLDKIAPPAQTIH